MKKVILVFSTFLFCQLLTENCKLKAQSVGISSATFTPGAMLEIRGSGTTSGTSALIVANSTPTTMFTILNNGNLNLPTTTSGGMGVFTMNSNRYIHSYGNENFFAGINAGNFTHSSEGSVGIGYSTLAALTGGWYNTAIGANAMGTAIPGHRNTAIGYNALKPVNTGAENVAVGAHAMQASTGGAASVVIGAYAQQAGTGGNQNTVVGYMANGTGVTTGTSQYNTFVGAYAGEDVTTAASNTGIGAYSLMNLVGADYNVALGRGTLSTLVSGTDNVAVGYAALNAVTTSRNVGIGYTALSSATSGEWNTAVGYNAGGSLISGHRNVFLGYNAGSSETGSDKLYIANAAGTALVYGDFGTSKTGIGGTLTPASTLDVEGNMAIGATYSGTTAAPTNGLTVEGNVGIGTASPASRMHVHYTQAGADVAGGAVHIGRYYNSGDASNVWRAGAIFDYYSSFLGREALGIGVVDDATGQVAPTEVNGGMKMMIGANGNVGINTFQPSAKLHISNSTGNSANEILSQASGDAVGGIYSFRKSRGTQASPTAVSAADVSGEIDFTAYNDAHRLAAIIKGEVETGVAATGADMPGRLTFWTSPDGSATPAERMRITNAGNVGIGTTAPSAVLHAIGGVSLDPAFKLDFAGWTGAAYTTGLNLTETSASGFFGQHILMYNTAYNTYGSIFTANNNGMYFTANNSAGATDVRFIFRDGNSNNAVYISTAANEPTLKTVNLNTNSVGLEINAKASQTADLLQVKNSGGTVINTITAAGNVGIACTAPTEVLYVTGNIKATGTVLGTQAACSDVRWKKNFKPINNENTLEKLLALNSYRYEWRTSEFPEKNFSSKTEIGFKAQDVEKYYPEIIFTDKEGYKYLDYSRLTPVLVEAIKQQQQQIEALTKRLNEIEKGKN